MDYLVANKIDGEGARGEDFLQDMENMRMDGTWMTDREIYALAYLLDTPIYSCVQQRHRNDRDARPSFAWQRQPHQQRKPVGNKRAIYILNAYDHFQLVTKP